MASATIAGLTVKIGAETQGFQNAIKEIDRVSRNVAKDLKTVSESMKLDPTAIQTYGDKFKLLEEAVEQSAKKVKLAQDAITALDKDFKDGKVSPEDYEKSLKALNRQLESAEYEYERNISALRNYDKGLKTSSDGNRELGETTHQANEEIKGIKTSTDDAGKGVLSLSDIIKGNLISDAIKSGLHAIADAAKKIGTAVWNALKDIASGVKTFVKEGIDLAEEYRQTAAKVKQIFGESADAIMKWSENAATSMGLTRGEAQEAAATFGNMFAALGITGDEAVNMSMDLVQLAADVAAFNNVTTAEVLENFKSGLAGTSRQLREYGIVINEAMIKEKALELGLASTADELTEGDKIIARYALMMEQAAHQTGQFARESDSATVQSQILEAVIKQLKADIGEKLIPVQARLYALINQILSNPAIMAFFDTVISKVGELAQSFNDLLADLDFDDLNGGFEQLLSQIVNKLMSVLPDIVEFGGSLIESLLQGIEKYLPLVLAAATPIVTTIVTGIIENLPTVVEGAFSILQTICDAIMSNINILAPMATNLVLKLVTFIIDNLPSVVQAAIDIVLSLVNGISESLPTLIPAAAEMIMTIAQTIVDNLPEIVAAAYNLIINFANGLLNSIPVIIERLPQIITSIIDFLANCEFEFVDAGYTLLTSIIKNLPEIIEAVLVGIAQLLAGIVNYFSEHGSDIVQAGKDLVSKLWDGVLAMKDWFVNNFTGWVSGLWSKILSVFRKDADEEASNWQDDFEMNPPVMSGQDPYGDLTGTGTLSTPSSVFVPSSVSPYRSGGNTNSTINNNNSVTVGDVIVNANSYGMDLTTVSEELGYAIKQNLRMSGARL